MTVAENGEPVDGLKVSSLGAQSAVVLAIDTSRSMRGKLSDAMAAARAFADRRLPDQRLGIIFFSGEPTVALEPTTDAAAIDRTLAKAPAPTLGTPGWLPVVNAPRPKIDRLAPVLPLPLVANLRLIPWR